MGDSSCFVLSGGAILLSFSHSAVCGYFACEFLIFRPHIFKKNVQPGLVFVKSEGEKEGRRTLLFALLLDVTNM